MVEEQLSMPGAAVGGHDGVTPSQDFGESQETLVNPPILGSVIFSQITVLFRSLTWHRLGRRDTERLRTGENCSLPEGPNCIDCQTEHHLDGVNEEEQICHDGMF